MKKLYFLLLSLCLFTDVNAQIVTIPNANFKARLLAASFNNQIAKDINGNSITIDINNNSQIELTEALQVYSLSVKSVSINDPDISSLIGISSFTNLQNLDCGYNNLTTLDVSGLPNLEVLYCNDTNINSLNVSGLTNLQTLDCYGCELTSLDLSGLINLQTLVLVGNQLTSLNVIGATNLENLYCNSNQLTSLNVSDLTNLQVLKCEYNQLISLFIKNGIEEMIYISNNPNLAYVCADESQLSSIQNTLNNYGLTNTVVNSYCSFTPGGTIYDIQGNTRLDSNNNGCDILDSVYPNLNFSITDGLNIGNFISNASGNYSILVSEGTHAISPVIENPTYFNVSPSTVNITFPPQTSPFTQNFCVTPNGTHQDLEVVLLPLSPVRPGFDSTYKIVYKNKGTNTQSGSFTLSFNDAISDYVSSTLPISSQTTNALSWNYTNLQPFETREVTVVINVNSPVETPAVNNGDPFGLSADITPVATDEYFADNHSELKQIVVGSYDPNDKTCLEGTTITPSMVGKYVHYMIRFENTGTYAAENVVVKDIINATKFDVSTLVPTSGSHSFVTRITAGNIVEFIFENINLPFDDANNDGYVAFKIKTKPTLMIGSTFSNTAGIYFDYNAPIVTNTATTTIAVLGTPDFEFSTYFSLYPNPTDSMLNIDLKKEIEVSSINIYNTLGQLVLVIPNAQQVKTVDVSGLTTGNYFMKLNTDKGTATAKFIKN